MFLASGEKLPSPVASSSSSLPKTSTFAMGFGSHTSLTLALRPIFTKLWFGGQSEVLARLAFTTGGMVSWTTTLELHVLVLPEASFALQVNGVVPKLKVDPEGGVQPKS